MTEALTELSKRKLQRYQRLAARDREGNPSKAGKRSKFISLAGEKLKEGTDREGYHKQLLSSWEESGRRNQAIKNHADKVHGMSDDEFVAHKKRLEDMSKRAATDIARLAAEIAKKGGLNEVREYHVFSGQTVHSKHQTREDALAAVKEGQRVGKVAPRFGGQGSEEFQ